MYLKGKCLCNRAVSRKLFKAIMGREARVITKTKELVSSKEVSMWAFEHRWRRYCMWDPL